MLTSSNSSITTRLKLYFTELSIITKSLIIVIFIAFLVNILFLSDEDTKDINNNSDANLTATAVVVASVRKGGFDIYKSGLGTVKPLNEVDVSSRVDGQLTSLNFIEGQTVTAGDLLATVDSTSLESQLKLAKGKLVLNEVMLNKAKADLERHRILLKQDSTSRQTVESKESTFRQYESLVAANNGEIDNIELQLEYANIVAPIGGRLGFRQLDVGNIIRASSGKAIVTISQLDPISVVFSIPEDILFKVLKKLKKDEKLIVDIYDRKKENKITEGYLLAVDNEIDASTGTIKLKAEVSNTEGKLFANQFVNIKMSVEHLSNAILVPTTAIQYGAPGAFIYIVDSDNTAIVTPIVISATQGEVTAIKGDIPVDALVVVEGSDRLKSGAKVKIISTMKVDSVEP